MAVAKARTASLALQPSGTIKLPGGIVDGIQHLYGGDFVPWAGGVPVTDGDVILGAAGASGTRAVEDEEAVRAAVRRGQEGRGGRQPAVVPGARNARALPRRTWVRRGSASYVVTVRRREAGRDRSFAPPDGAGGPRQGAGWDRGGCDGAGGPFPLVWKGSADPSPPHWLADHRGPRPARAVRLSATPHPGRTASCAGRVRTS
ncbi:heme-binding protein [Streptomyces sp. NPDC052301]|uniref:heme-binding protein n=1 Tax=Streptomyces sp. NPDC052301 TaxID=3365687 RepID=UPI0037D55BD6